MSRPKHAPAPAPLDFSDTRAGTFYVLDGARRHEDDLTPLERERLGLPALPAPAAESPSEPSAS